MRRIVLVLIIFIVVIAVGLGGLYYYSNFLATSSDIVEEDNEQQDISNVNQNTNQQPEDVIGEVIEEEVFQTKLFNIALPENWVFEEKQGIDSYVGEFRGDGIALFFDYGWYSGDPSQGDDNYQVIQENIDGFNARLFSSRANQDAGVYFANLPNNNRLTIYGQNISSLKEEKVFEFFRSIKFIQQDAAATTLICRNETYGYELVYPSDWHIWTEANENGVKTNCQSGRSSLTFSRSDQTFSTILTYLTIKVLDSSARIGTEYENINSLDDYEAIITTEKNRQVINGLDFIIEEGRMVTFNDGLLYLVPSNLIEEVILQSANNFKFIKKKITGPLTFVEEAGPYRVTSVSNSVHTKLEYINPESGEAELIFESLTEAAGLENESLPTQLFLQKYFEDELLLFYSINPDTDSRTSRFWRFDPKTSALSEAKVNEVYIGWGGSALSEDGRYLAYSKDHGTFVNGHSQELYLLDLLKDEYILIERLGEEESFNSNAYGGLSIDFDISWLDDNTIEYGVFDQTNIPENTDDKWRKPLIEKRTYKLN